MLKRFAVFLGTFSLALFILVVSIFRIAEIKYVFSQAPNPTPTTMKPIEINYNLPYPGRILPDSPFWPLVALRDRIWITLTVNPSKKADLYLLIADKRLADSKILFENGKADLGISVLTKAEKYLESANYEEKIAQRSGMDTSQFLQRYLLATLKHRIVIEELVNIAPEDAKPLIIKSENYSKNLYSEARNGLLEAHATVPQSPFKEN